jgi:hypothetical protein
MNQQQNSKMSFTDFRSFVNLTIWGCHILSIALNVFLHVAPGERYIGLPGLIVIPLLMVWGGFTANYGGQQVTEFVPLYMLMCLVWNGYAVFRRRKLRRLVHTRYAGMPLLCFALPWFGEITVRRVESLMVFVAGAFLYQVNQPAGSFLCVAALGQLMSLQIQQLIELNKRLDEMDNMIEQSERAGRSREMLGQ